MKKLLVLMLCAMLAVPSVNMGVQAAGDEKTFEQMLTDAFVELYDYYVVLEINENEKSEADNAMKTAAQQLGFDYIPADKAPKAGSFESNGKPALQSESGIENCVTTTKAKLDKITAEQPKEEKPVENPSVNSNIIIGGKEYDTTIANAGAECTIAVPLVNLGDSDVTNVVITPVLSEDVKSWPFEISKTDYSQTLEKLQGLDSGIETLKRKHTFRWTLKTRKDAVTGYTKLTFNVGYNEADGSKGSVALDYYVQVNGVAATEESAPEETGKISTPRVIVTGFTTTPEEVYAGDTFTLTLNLKNTSKKTAVSNMLFDIQGTQEGTDAANTYAAFLPTAGSSTIYVDRIGADSSKSISIELKSKADLAQKPYVVTVEMEYEDSDANSFTETASVSVPIKQEAKVDVSDISIMPDMIEIGNEANVMFSIYNVGKTKLYNVNVKFDAASVSGGDTFLGNIDTGATGNVDAYLTAQSVTEDDGTVKILITYEDEEGKQSSIEKTMTLFVSEPYFEDVMMDDMMMGEMEEENRGISGWLIGGIAAAAVIAGVVTFFIIRKKKRAKRQESEELELIELNDELEELGE